MKQRSLHLRLLVAAALAITAALFMAGVALTTLFEREVSERIDQELDNDLVQLLGSLEVTADGQAKLQRPLADPRFDQALGGRYWRIIEKDAKTGAWVEILRSRSFWDAEFLPTALDMGPEGEALITRSRNVTYRIAGQDRALTLMVFAHDDEVSSPLNRFRNRLTLYLSCIGLALIAAGWLQVSIGLRPLKRLGEQLQLLRQHRAKRLAGDFPSEVAPLVAGFNDVLDERDISLKRARHRAGDLAHGLMTPLTVLSAMARDLRKRELGPQADEIEAQVLAMRAHVERGLVRARLATGRGHELTLLNPCVAAVISTLIKLPKGEDMVWLNEIGAEVRVPIERQDLLELLGNLLDNARKYGHSQVRISFADHVLRIEDDGPGVPESDLARITARGQRLDESRKGFGLGLSIVADVVDLYELHIRYARSALGGLLVEIDVSGKPTAEPAAPERNAF